MRHCIPFRGIMMIYQVSKVLLNGNKFNYICSLHNQKGTFILNISSLRLVITITLQKNSPKLKLVVCMDPLLPDNNLILVSHLVLMSLKPIDQVKHQDQAVTLIRKYKDSYLKIWSKMV